MHCIEIDTGRWRIDMGNGLGIEIVLLFSRTIAFWLWRSELVAEMPVGDG